MEPIGDLPYMATDPGQMAEAARSPAWTREGYEYEMADRIIANAATIRYASRECGRLEGKAISMSAVRRDPEWRMWDGRRGFCANEICLLVRGMRGYGYATDDSAALGEFLKGKYREMLRGGDAAKYGPCVYVPDGWLTDLRCEEQIALAPRIWADYKRQFEN